MKTWVYNVKKTTRTIIGHCTGQPCVIQHPHLTTENYAGTKFYCPHSFADINKHIQIKEKTAEFSSVASHTVSTILLHPFNGLFSRTTWVSRHWNGKPLMKQEMMGWQWHQPDHMHIICTSLHTDNHASTSPLSFYGLNALPTTQPTATKHCLCTTYMQLPWQKLKTKMSILSMAMDPVSWQSMCRAKALN